MGINNVNYSQVSDEWKEINSGLDNIKQLLKGITTTANAVGCTMGARGKTVIIHDGTKNTSTTTKDGVTVAKSIHLKDPIENIGANQLKDVANNVVKAAGDGTTTATVLTAALCKQCVELMEKGVQAYDIIQALEVIEFELKEHFKSSVYQIGDRGEPDEEVRAIARIASNSDEEITNLVFEAIKNTGENTVINVQHGTSAESYVEDTKGYSIDRGYLNRNFKDPNRVYVEYRNPLIFVTTEELVGSYDVEKIMAIAAEEARPLVIIAKDFLQDAYNYIAMNKLHTSFPVLPIKAPRFGDEQKAILEDIAVYTNATLATQERGFAFSMIELEDFGNCELIKSGSDYTHIFGGEHSDVLISERVEGLKERLEDLKDRGQHEHFTQSIKERISKLEDGICTIHVGGYTEQEAKEKYDRVEDSLMATNSALEHGYIVGGGLFYRRVGAMLIEDHAMDTVQYIARALFAPFMKIIENAMLRDDIKVEHNTRDIINAMRRKSKQQFNIGSIDMGVDVRTGQIVDFIEAGIIDAAASTEAIIDNAFSFVKTFINTEATIVHKLEYFKNVQ